MWRRKKKEEKKKEVAAWKNITIEYTAPVEDVHMHAHKKELKAPKVDLLIDAPVFFGAIIACLVICFLILCVWICLRWTKA